MTILIGVIIGLIALTILVVAHEFGHAVAAKRNGVEVEEFGIGFPPKIFAKKLKNGVLFTINALPLGGFVKLQGENDAASEKGDFGSASFWQKTKILFAGVVMNWILAFILLTILAITGMPKAIDNQFTVPGDTTTILQSVTITSTNSGYPADKSGLREKDKIIKFAGEDVKTSEQLVSLIKQNKGQTVDVVYERDDLQMTTKVSLSESDEKNIFFGASFGQNEMTKSTWSAPIVGVVTTLQFTRATFQGLGNLFVNLFNGLIMQFSPDVDTQQEASASLKAVGDSVSGPVGILGVIFPAAGQAGLTQVVFLTAILSISLAVVNILPIPALDGGRWLVMAIYKIRKKTLEKATEEKIQMIGFIILMILIIIVTVADVAKII